MPIYDVPTEKLRECVNETFSLLNESEKGTLYYATDISLAKQYPEVKGYGAAVLNCIELREFLKRYEVGSEGWVYEGFKLLTRGL